MKPELQDHITTLRAYQAWRTGADTRTLGGAGIIPADIAKALNAVLDFAENHLRDATKMLEPVKVPSYCTHPKCLIASGCSGPCRYGQPAPETKEPK